MLIEGVEVREILLFVDGVYDLDGMLNVIDDNMMIVWVCNLNNLIGNYIDLVDI